MPVILGVNHFYANQMTEAEEDYDNFKTIKWIVEYDRTIRELEAEIKKLPYMQPFLSIEQELENSDKRIELRKRIETFKNSINE